jgi:LDH2 family malate/lactate/ureidoglycolate dehydrogenase
VFVLDHSSIYDAPRRPQRAGPLPDRIDAPALKDWTAAVLHAAGLSSGDAGIMAHVLVETDLMGVDTHGVLKLPMYIRRALAGGSNPGAQLRIVRESATTALADAEGGFGQVMGWKAMELAIEKARRHDVGIVSVTNSNTLTAQRVYTLRAAEAGMIGICVTNADPQMAPVGGRKKLLGTNPWSVAVPGGQFPVVFDQASTTVAWTKLALAAMRGEALPPGWALDEQGSPTTDPQAGMAGSVTPLGGHKGFALAVMAEILTGVLSGGRVADEITNYGTVAANTGVSHLLMAINVEAFQPLESFKLRVDGYVARLVNSPLAEGAAAITVPGMRTWRVRAERQRTGIPLMERLAQNLVALGEVMEIPFPA